MILTYFSVFFFFFNISPVQTSTILEQEEGSSDGRTSKINADTEIAPDLFQTIPMEKIMEIMEFLDLKSLLQARQVSQNFKSIIDTDSFQKNFCGLAREEHNVILTTKFPQFNSKTRQALIDFLEKNKVYHYILKRLISEENKGILTTDLQNKLLETFPFHNEKNVPLPHNIKLFLFIASYAATFFTKNMNESQQSYIIKALTKVPRESVFVVIQHATPFFAEYMHGHERVVIIKAFEKGPEEGTPLKEHCVALAKVLSKNKAKIFSKYLIYNRRLSIIKELAALSPEQMSELSLKTKPSFPLGFYLRDIAEYKEDQALGLSSHFQRYWKTYAGLGVTGLGLGALVVFVKSSEKL